MNIKINIIKKIFFFRILFVFVFLCLFNKEISRKVKSIDKPKVLIIVPVYNVKEWLPDC